MADMKPIKLVGICGSLRKASYNRMALNAAAELLPPGMSLELADISKIPVYDDDVRAAGYPEAVVAFRNQVRAADAVLFATPEYIYSVSGALKNALDWVSRQPDLPFDGKPAAIMGASMGPLGTARAQYHLRQCLQFLNCLPVAKPEVMIGMCQNKFDGNGKLNDEPTRKAIVDLLTALDKWTRRLRGD